MNTQKGLLPFAPDCLASQGSDALLVTASSVLNPSVLAQLWQFDLFVLDMGPAKKRKVSLGGGASSSLASPPPAKLLKVKDELIPDLDAQFPHTKMFTNLVFLGR